MSDTEATSSNASVSNNVEHAAVLDKLCRVCSKIIKVKDRCYEVKNYHDELSQTFVGVKFADDTGSVHPSKFCFSCYGAINNFKKRGTVPTYKAVKWYPHTSSNCISCEISVTKGKGGRPSRKGSKESFGRPKSIVDVREIMTLDANSTISPSLHKAASHIMALAVKKSPDQVVQLPSGGPNPISLLPITVAHKESQHASKRTIRARTQEVKRMTSIVSGGTKESISTQNIHMIKSFDQKEREEIVKGMKTLMTVPANVVASMKSTLGLPWNLVRELRRWFKTLKVNVATESSVRDVYYDWIGNGVRTEELPANVLKDGKVVIVMRAWTYIYNLVGYVIS